MFTSLQRKPSASPCRKPKAKATDQRAELRRAAAMSTTRLASALVKGSISEGSYLGDCDSGTGFMARWPRSTAAFRAADSVRLTCAQVAAPAVDVMIEIHSRSMCSAFTRLSRISPTARSMWR